MENQYVLSRCTGEFVATSKENAFLAATWDDYKTTPQYTFLILGVMSVAFALLSIAEVGTSQLAVLMMRFLIAICLTSSGVYLFKASDYFAGYPFLLLLNQLLIALSIFTLTAVGQVTAVYLVASIIGLTLIYYQFFYNKFWFTVCGSLILGAGAIVTSYHYLDLTESELVGFLILLLFVNLLGIFSLRSINRTKRREYRVRFALLSANEAKQMLIHELQDALAEVKTLEGFIPICANCHHIRNDEGFWERVDKYIQDRTDAQFSHSICPDCMVELYPELYKRENGKLD